MSESTFATGRCACGAVSYTVGAAPVRMAQCHCKDCQRASGSGHMSLAFFKEDDVTISGETASYASATDSGNTNTRHFCPTCGSRVLGRNSGRPGVVALPVGCIDEHDWFKPQATVYASRRPVWDQLAADAPSFDKMPPPPAKK